MAAQREFVRERDWDQFHTPKNIAMALGCEVGELAEALSSLLVLSDSPSRVLQSAIIDEVGDVALYLLRLHDVGAIGPTPMPHNVHLHNTDSPFGQLDRINLAEAICQLAAAAGRILEIFQWQGTGASDDEESRRIYELLVIRLEVADIKLSRLCALLGVDPLAAAAAKITKNALKYPVESSRGSSQKYTEIDGG